jgi:hypothetical protein
MNEYPIGKGLRFETECYDEDDALEDPTVLVFRWKEPDGTITSYTYGVDAELVRDALGLYHVDRTLNAAGIHTWRWKASGLVTDADEKKLKAKPSAFENP